MTVIVRQPVKRVWVNGVEVRNCLSARTTFSFAMRISQAEATFPYRPDVRQWDWIEIEMGPTLSEVRKRFAGYVIEVSSTYYPLVWTIVARGPLVRAEFKHGEASDLTPDGLDLSNGGAGQTDQAMVQQVLTACGVPNLSIDGTGKILGTIADDQFFWGPDQSGLSFIESLDEICLGFRTFNTPAGATVRRRVSGVPATTPAVVFTEGVDIETGEGSRRWLDVVNEWTVEGFDGQQYTATQSSPFLPPGITARPDRLSNPKIEREVTSDPGQGLSCQEVAEYLLGETNRERFTVRLTTPRGDLLFPGMVVGVRSPQRLGAGSADAVDLFWLQEVTTQVDEANQFSQELTCIGGRGSSAPIEGLFKPIADFTIAVEVEVIVAGTEQSLYVVHCESTSTGLSAPITTLSWSAPGGSPSSGTGKRFTTTYTDLAGRSITLTATDANGRSDTRTKTVTEAVPDRQVVTRRLAIAAGHAEAWDGDSYNLASPPSGSVTVVANGPLWAAGATLMRSPDYLTTAPLTSQPFGAGTAITAIWVETDADASRVALGAADGRVAISTDGGATWTVKPGPSSEPVLRVILSRFARGQVHVLTSSAYYVSDNDGDGWRLIRAAASGQTFRELVLSHTRNVIASQVSGTGSPLERAEDGTPFTFPSLTPPVTDVIAVTADIVEDRFYCYDAQGRTFYTTTSGGVAMGRGADLPSPSQAQPRGLWRDGAIKDLLYIAIGTAGLYKSIDGFQTSSGYYQLRAPGIAGAPASADYRMVGADGLLMTRRIAETIIVSSGGTGKAKSLWNGTANTAPPFGWESLGFNDSAWGPTVAAQYLSAPRDPIAGTDGVWSSTLPAARNEQCLIRHTFVLPGGVISEATLTVKYDDSCNGVWINGVFIVGSIDETQDIEPERSITIDPSILRPGQTNIIAVWGRDNPLSSTPDAFNRAYVSYKLVVR